jgi:hypothetical protein
MTPRERKLVCRTSGPDGGPCEAFREISNGACEHIQCCGGDGPDPGKYRLMLAHASGDWCKLGKWKRNRLAIPAPEDGVEMRRVGDGHLAIVRL